MATVDIRPQLVLKSQLRSDKERPARMLHFCNLIALKTDLKNTTCSENVMFEHVAVLLQYLDVKYKYP